MKIVNLMKVVIIEPGPVGSWPVLLATEPGVVGKGTLPVVISSGLVGWGTLPVPIGSGSVGTGPVPVIVGWEVTLKVLTGIETKNRFQKSGPEKIFSFSSPIYKLSILCFHIFELFFLIFYKVKLTWK